MAAVNSSPSGDDRSIHERPARSGSSQHGAWRAAIWPRAASATSGPHPWISSPGTASLRSSRSRVNQASTGSSAANRSRGTRVADPGRHLGVEPHLDLVGPHDPAGAEALLVLGGELADHARRPGAGGLVVQGEPDGVGHLARPDRRGGDRRDPGAVRQQTPVRQDVRQPPGVDRLGGPPYLPGSGRQRVPGAPHAHRSSAAAEVSSRWRWRPRCTSRAWVGPCRTASTNSSTTVVVTEGPRDAVSTSSTPSAGMDLDPGPGRRSPGCSGE